MWILSSLGWKWILSNWCWPIQSNQCGCEVYVGWGWYVRLWKLKVIQTGSEVFFSMFLYMISSGKSASHLIRSFYNPPTITILHNNKCPLYATGTPRLRLCVPHICDFLMCTQQLSCVWLFVTPWTIAHQAPLWNFPGKNTGVDCHSLLQEILPTQG